LERPSSRSSRPSSAVPQEYPFAYYGDGQDFHAYPILRTRKAGLSLGKFDGGYGSRGTLCKPRREADFTRGAEARVAHRIAKLIQLERERILQGQTPTRLCGQVRELALEYYNTSLKPLLRRARLTADLPKPSCQRRWLAAFYDLLLGAAAETDPNLAADGRSWIR